MERLTVIDCIAKKLESYGVNNIFGLPSDDLKFYHACENSGIDYLVARDQKNAMFMAVGYALAKRKTAVCNIGKGPAVAYGVGGLLEAKTQSAPLIVIASGTTTEQLGHGKSFQEANQMDIVKPVVKWSHRVDNPDSLHWVLEKAFYLANNGTPGPVYIEIPEDIGDKMVVKSNYPSLAQDKTRFLPDRLTLDLIIEKIGNSKYPALIIGGGCRGIKDKSIIMAFAEKIGAAIFVSASGRGVINEEHPQFSGVSGLYCSGAMIEYIKNVDLFVSLGSKLEETALFGLEEYILNNELIEININNNHFNFQINSLKVQGEVEVTLEELLKLTPLGLSNECNIGKLLKLKEKDIVEKRRKLKEISTLSVLHILDNIQQEISSECIFVHENGLQDMWSYFYPYFTLKNGQESIVPSEQTSLGFGCAAAIGAVMANPKTPVIAFVGDGAFNLFSSELVTLVINKIPIIYVVLNNGGYGWLEYQNTHSATYSFAQPHIPLVSIDSNQLKHFKVREKSELNSILLQALNQYSFGRTVIVEALVDLQDVPASLTKIYGDFPERGKSYES